MQLRTNRIYDFSVAAEFDESDTLARFCSDEMAAGNVINSGELVADGSGNGGFF